jgi:hypothetical protein
MGEVTSIAIANARLFERERQGAIVEERERIAREMHDGMAQVLGVTHLRLRALEAAPEVRDLTGVHEEISNLADLCLEAYSDVRESILGLHEASRVDRALMESLRAYIEKYSKQSGIPTRLDADPDHEVVLPTRYPVQVIRVIQEALTNVRKHSGASGRGRLPRRRRPGHGHHRRRRPRVRPVRPARGARGWPALDARTDGAARQYAHDRLGAGSGHRVVATVPSPHRNGRIPGSTCRTVT